MTAVCVFCASSKVIDARYIDLAADLGTTLASNDISLVSGGGSVSMMGAVAQAVRNAGGNTVGVIPQALVDMEVADHESDELIVTGDMRTRKAEMDRRSDAFIVLPGGIGTLEELTEIWTARTLGMHAKPIIVLDPWGDYSHLHALIGHLVEQGFVRSDAAAHIAWVSSVAEAMDALRDGLRAHPSLGEGDAAEALESLG